MNTIVGKERTQLPLAPPLTYRYISFHRPEILLLFAYLLLSLPLFSLQIEHTLHEHNPTQKPHQYSLSFGKKKRKKKHLGTVLIVVLISFNDYCSIFRHAEWVSSFFFNLLFPMKRGYQESPSTSVGPPQSKARHDPQGKYFSVLALAHLFFHLYFTVLKGLWIWSWLGLTL